MPISTRSCLVFAMAVVCGLGHATEDLPRSGDSAGEGQTEPIEAEHGRDGERAAEGKGEPGEGQDVVEGEVTESEVYVSSVDGDNTNDGTMSSPWRTIAYAQRRIAATPLKPITVNLAPGEYNEQVFMPKHTRLVGTKENDPSGVVIRPPLEALEELNYAVLAEEDTELRNLSIRLDVDSPPDVVLLRINDVNMTVRDVFMSGGDVAGSVGVSILREGSSDSLVTHSRIERVDFGVRAIETNANITQNAFRNIRFDGVFVRDPSPEADGGTLLLGVATRVDTGHNTFVNVEEKLVRNLGVNEVKAEMNDWGICCYEEILGKMDGKVDFVPYGPHYHFSASLVCVLVDENESPINTATVHITPAVSSPVTANVDGVYVFPALQEGTYTVSATAPDYASAERTVTLIGGQDKTIKLVLKRTDGAEGESSTGEAEQSPGEGESNEPAGCFASESKRAGLPAAPDLFVAALSLLALAWAAARRPS